MRVDRTNRVVLAIVGLLLLAAGIAALVAGAGGFGATLADRALVDNAVADFIARNGDWFWPVLGVVALIVALLSLWWIAKLLLFSTDRVGTVELPARGRADRTTVVAGAVTDAVSREIEGYGGVESARATLTGSADRPALAVTVDAQRTADLAALRHRIESEAIDHARQALDRPDLPVTLDLTIRRREGARVA